MEVTIQWFWLIKLAFVGITFGTAYLAWKSSTKKDGKKFNIWTILTIILVVIGYIQPIKLDSTVNNIKQQQRYTDSIMKNIQDTKAVKNNSLETINKAGIKESDIWDDK